MKWPSNKLFVWPIVSTVFSYLVACTALPPILVTPEPTAPSETEVMPALNQRLLLAMQLGLEVAEVDVVEVESVTWPDSCLGKPDPTELCAAAETPGYRIRLTANGAEYVYHTNEDGSSVRLAAAPDPAIGAAILSWKHADADGSCRQAHFGTDRLAFGRCGSVQMGVPFALEERRSDLARFASTFGPFDGETSAGSVEFAGTGVDDANPAQQRMLAEWANLVQQEARVGRSGASWGLALAWHREGGFAGFCDDVAAYVTGKVYLSSCRGAQPDELVRFWLNAEQLETLYGWIDAFAPFEYKQSDPAQTDQMTVTLVFAGEGDTEATEPEQAAIVDFAQNLFNEGAVTAVEVQAECSQAEADQQLLVQKESGYCLVYPGENILWQQSPNSIEIVMDTIMNHVDPRASISVEEANWRALADAVAEVTANYAPPGLRLYRN